MMMMMIAYDVREGGREKEERDCEIPYTLPCLDLLFEKETQDLVYIAIALFSSVHFKHKVYAILFLDGTRLEEVVKKTV